MKNLSNGISPKITPLKQKHPKMATKRNIDSSLIGADGRKVMKRLIQRGKEAEIQGN